MFFNKNFIFSTLWMTGILMVWVYPPAFSSSQSENQPLTDQEATLGSGAPSSQSVALQIDGIPRVFTTPKIVPDPKRSEETSVQITPPYFSFRFSLRNDSPSDHTLVVTGVRVSIFTKENQSWTPDATVEYLPSGCFFEKNGANPCALFDSQTFAVLLPTGDLHAMPLRFYVENLPEQEGFIYTVHLEILGFWSEESDPLLAAKNEHYRLERTKVTFFTE